MDPVLKRRLMFWLPLLLALLGGLIWLFYPRAIAVDLAQVVRGPLQVTISDEGTTRVRDMFVVSAPLSGFMRRVELEPGDKVIAGKTLVARLEPADPGMLDARTLAAGQAAVSAAASARIQAQAEARRAASELEFANAEFKRIEALFADGTVPKSDFEAAQRQAKSATAMLEQAQAALKVREAEYKRAQAQLWSPDRSAQDNRDVVLVRSPVNGVVLRVVAKSESIVQSGMPIVELGDARQLEVTVDLLSADAVKVKPGQRVRIDAWGGEQPLSGVVHQVEPFGFTKVSALGIEEQRVRAIIEFTDDYARWQRLGHGYRVEPHIIIWEATDVITAPLSSLFRDQEQWSVFVARNGRAELRHVSVGHQNGLNAEILSGLQPGEWIVSYPDDRIAPGVRVEQR